MAMNRRRWPFTAVQGSSVYDSSTATFSTHYAFSRKAFNGRYLRLANNPESGVVVGVTLPILKFLTFWNRESSVAGRTVCPEGLEFAFAAQERIRPLFIA
jgi:hypothetical protein